VGAAVTVTANEPELLQVVVVFVTTTLTLPLEVPTVAVMAFVVPPDVIFHPEGTDQLYV
jgi:hypothetical protein